MESLKLLLDKPEFPRSNRYDHEWIMRCQMGPNALWLVEWLTRAMTLKPGMRVLDLGCGKAMTSVFLAREFDVQVWATDLWTDVDENWARVREAHEERRVFPVHAEAHALPYPKGFFDAIISIDAWQYFGTDTLYLEYISRFLNPGGQLGVAIPGLTQPIEDEPPAHLTGPQSNGYAFWEPECICFHTHEWWLRHWKRSARMKVRTADLMPDGWRHWRDFELAVACDGRSVFPSVAEALDVDRGRYLGFVRLVGERNESEGMNLYDHALLHKVEGPEGPQKPAESSDTLASKGEKS